MVGIRTISSSVSSAVSASDTVPGAGPQPHPPPVDSSTSSMVSSFDTVPGAGPQPHPPPVASSTVSSFDTVPGAGPQPHPPPVGFSVVSSSKVASTVSSAMVLSPFYSSRHTPCAVVKTTNIILIHYIYTFTDTLLARLSKKDGNLMHY